MSSRADQISVEYADTASLTSDMWPPWFQIFLDFCGFAVGFWVGYWIVNKIFPEKKGHNGSPK